MARQIRLVPGSFTGDLWVIRHQTRGGKPTGYVWVKGWKRAIPNWANTQGPPAHGAPLYGPKAPEYVRALWRAADRKPKINIGALSKIALLAVVRGDTPLSEGLWARTRSYIAAKRAEQGQQLVVEERERAAVEHRAPMRVMIGGLGRPLAVRIGAPPSIPAPE